MPVEQQAERAVMDEHIAYWIRTPQDLNSRSDGYSTFSTKLLTDYHHNSIIKLSVRWCVWKVGEGFSNQV